ncbi:hypothetical protein FPE01S_01_13950 [Flavihumibacter petaseus NBRC 106054]|uniref:DUF3089 domain-containing protein n=2 Tax=Flavihumibacter TaxID=1004301 RepID=A0A0E9MZ61_9BACT|nr:hypothetical protein FPE01S_01_13950 [Flavihumibacter petaseus NBRC 106054]
MIVLASACARKQVPVSSSNSITTVSVSGPDYSDYRNWAALPQMPDPSDSVPLPLRADYKRDTTVDVFFIHPTTFTMKETGEWNASLEDSSLNAKTDRSAILYQASVFNRYNVYAPRYRQAHLRAYYTDNRTAATDALDLAYSDIKRAFQYYLQTQNHGRPVIIASHSQGTTHAKRLLKEFFDGKPLQQQLVAAYILGIPVEPDYFVSLPVCNAPAQTGCYITWRTFRRGFEPDYDSTYRRSVVVNPLSWKADTSYSPATLNRGAVLRDFNRVLPEVNDAQVYKDLLWISRPHFPGSRFYRARNYHIGDYNLFYVNIRENAGERVTAYEQR